MLKFATGIAGVRDFEQVLIDSQLKRRAHTLLFSLPNKVTRSHSNREVTWEEPKH